ncbi:isopeptide-forming domain-containing fimbrial protein [Bifidobacterium sp. ESL0690]|uniref:isopeptide-forming domain-containing fimbrial protein n=1 Tax=Bifidobacterium sp. ESL0690 TaxID=2983214 RepID=UPI0023F70C25|nr:isopeptide-forming domain-containing fimbrial protein [Bifidobacterium sp. ESL0690]WEV46613.1 isopeptide-forming domain-containing fimbrial protein [Bifidobacterium sp. ESL0690]
MLKQRLTKIAMVVFAAVVCVATLFAGAPAASADEFPGTTTPDHGAQPLVPLKIKRNGPGETLLLNIVKIGDYVNQNPEKNTLKVTTNSASAKEIVKQPYPYTDTKSVFCEYAGFGTQCETDYKEINRDPMNWLADQWSKETLAGETSRAGMFAYNMNITGWWFSEHLGSDTYGTARLEHNYEPECDGICAGVSENPDSDGNPVDTILLPNGVYFISAGWDYLSTTERGEYEPIIVSTVGGELDTQREDYLGTKVITMKGNQDGSITKTVGKKTYNIGDSVKYTINAVLPSTWRWDSLEKFKVRDTFSKGLSYVSSDFKPEVFIDGQPVEPAKPGTAGYVLQVRDETCPNPVTCTTNLADSPNPIPGAYIVFDFSDYIHGTTFRGKSLKIVYWAKLNGSAGTSDATANEAKMTYSFHVDTGCGCGTGPNDTWERELLAARVNVYTGGFSLHVPKTSWNLSPEGAAFTVSHKEDPTHPIKFAQLSTGNISSPAKYCAAEASQTNSTDTIRIPASGDAEITGLADGTYIIHQTAAPGNWEMLESYDFEITLKHQDQGDGTESLTQSIGSNPYGMASQDGDGKVVNVRYIGALKDVPATSPVGTGVRVLIGVMALMCGIGILVGMKRLMRRRNVVSSARV